MVASPPTSQNWKLKKKKNHTLREGSWNYLLYSKNIFRVGRWPEYSKKIFWGQFKKKGQFENLSDATATPGWWIARGSRNPSELASWIDGSTDLIRHQVCVYVGDEGSKDPGQTRGSNKWPWQPKSFKRVDKVWRVDLDFDFTRYLKIWYWWPNYLLGWVELGLRLFVFVL